MSTDRWQKAREERVWIFNDTRKVYETDGKLVDAIDASKAKQFVIAEGSEISTDRGTYDAPAKIIVSKRRSLEAAGAYADYRVCVLNFASATNPGGGVEKGSSAQEEAICRCSTLYPCIQDNIVKTGFHNQHRMALKAGRMTALYNDDCIYTPEVVVFKTDTDHPERMPEKEWYKVDIISCAAPNLRSNPSNEMNPDSGTQAVVIGTEELKALHKKRMGRVLDIAWAQGAEVIILGAFGCGAFQNPPNLVAEAMAEVVKENLHNFKVIEFAVYCPPDNTQNYDVFSSVLSDKR